MATKLLLLVASCVITCWGHPLEDYVKRPDSTYTYEVIDSDHHPNVTTLIVNMTSQTWMDASFSSQPVWYHYMIIAIPDNPTITDQAFQFVGIGNLDDDAPDPHNNTFSPIMRDFARATGAVAAYISNIPNQPISFPSDGIERTEDAIIARTWAIYMNMTEPKDPDVLLYMPMTKGVVRGMDTVTAVTTAFNAIYNIDKFVVGGPSKRGWTTWCVGAVDDRVVGLVPMVISILNMVPNLHHHYESLGGWSWAFQDYYYEGLTKRLDDPVVQELTYLQDPYEMRDNFTMPLYIIKAGNDEFFMLDDMQFYYDDLDQAPSKNLLILEDAIHIMLPHWRRLLATIPTWFVNVHRGIESTRMSWELQSSNTTAITTAFLNEQPINVTAWQCNTGNYTERRDFRWLVLDENGDNTTSGLEYEEIAVQEVGPLTYQVQVDRPAEGYTGFFIVATFPGYDSETTIEFSTEPNVVPNTFPYPPCVGAECEGSLK